MTATLGGKLNPMSKTAGSGATLGISAPVDTTAGWSFVAALLESAGTANYVPTSDGTFCSPLSPI